MWANLQNIVKKGLIIMYSYDGFKRNGVNYFIINNKLKILKNMNQVIQKAAQPVKITETANIKIDGPITGPLRLQTEGAINNLLRQGLKHLNLIINTPGGSTHEGIALFNFLKALKNVEIHTYNLSQVDSIGVVIFCAGGKRFANPNSRFLIHRVQTNLNGQASFDENLLIQMLNNLKMEHQQILDIIATACSKPKSEVESDIVNSKNMNSVDALSYGLVHQIETKLPLENLISIHHPLQQHPQQFIIPSPAVPMMQ